jgi:hypothetical protein
MIHVYTLVNLSVDFMLKQLYRTVHKCTSITDVKADLSEIGQVFKHYQAEKKILYMQTDRHSEGWKRVMHPDEILIHINMN